MAEPSEGICGQCRRTVAQRAMTRHLRRCVAGADGGAGALHVVVASQDDPVYWLHIAVARDAQMWDLDEFLRAIWLECCGHLSAFRIDGENYVSTIDEDGQGMDVAAGAAIEGARRIGYEYDFGSTTHLQLRVVGEVDVASAGSAGVALLARNLAPEIKCLVCKAAHAVEVCPYCGNFLCADCRKGHDCETDWLLPVVNSPRTGVCAYTGPTSDMRMWQGPGASAD